jgi:tripartite-type tricarboxylate transporter receptor subunit TctC
MSTIRVIGVSVLLTTALAFPALAEISFAGKQVTVIIGSKAGGGTDGQGRLLGAFLGEHLPGKPQVIYSNIPGSSGIKAINHFATRVKADGTSVLSASSVSLEPTTLKRSDVVKYDPREFAMIGGVTAGGTVMVIKADAKARLTDKSAQPVVVGAVDATRTGLSMAVWGAEYLGWNVKWVIGYSGTSALMMAIQQGEIDMTGTSSMRQIQRLLENSKLTGLVQAGDYEDGKFVGRTSFPDIAVFPDMVLPKVDGVAKEAFESWLYSNQVGKWFALPPKTPPEVAETYRGAYRKIMADPKFLERAKREFGEDFEPMWGENLTHVVKALASTSDEAMTFTTAMRVKHGLPAE